MQISVDKQLEKLYSSQHTIKESKTNVTIKYVFSSYSLPRNPLSIFGQQAAFAGWYVLILLSIGFENMYIEVSETGYRGFFRNTTPFVIHDYPSLSAIE
jgi:hypothetical protein